VAVMCDRLVPVQRSCMDGLKKDLRTDFVDASGILC